MTQTVSEEDRQKKQQRAHLQYSTERHDQTEFNKFTTDEVQELKFQVKCLYYISVTFIK